MNEISKGILAIILACVIWGLSPLYYNLLRHIPPAEVLAHRTLWSLVLFSLLLLIQGRIADLPRTLMQPRFLKVIALAALSISVNWFLFIWAIQHGHATEASFGYYIFPLVAVAIGWLFFGEALNPIQWAAIALASAAVAVLGFGLGTPPWMALIIATTFGYYGLIKKRLPVGPVVSVTAEVLLLSPAALGFLIIWTDGLPAPRDMALLIGSGPMTALPLILFSYTTRRVRMATVGLLQYINPTLQFMCAVTVLGEPLSFWHMVAFPLIWMALLLYSVAAFRKSPASSSKSSTV